MYPDAMDWCDAPFFEKEVFDDFEQKVRFAIDTSGWQPAKVFNRKKGHDLQNTNVRRHSNHVIDDKDMCRQLTQTIHERLSSLFPDDSFWIRDSHMDVLHYAEGDFFHRHEDFIKYFFPDVRLYVLLIGLETCQDGGETVVYAQKSQGVPYYGSVRKNRACFFPAHIPHESRVVKKGEKMCIKLDVFFVQRQAPTKMMMCRVGKTIFPFLHSWFQGFESFLESMSRFHGSQALDIHSIDEDTFRLVYRIFVHDYYPTREEKETVEDVWNMLFPDMSITDIKIWTTLTGWLTQPVTETHKNTCIWIRDIACFLRFYETYSTRVVPFIAFRYRDMEKWKKKWNVFSIIPLFSEGMSFVCSTEQGPPEKDWMLHRTRKFYYREHTATQKQRTFSMKTLSALKQKNQSDFIHWCDFHNKNIQDHGFHHEIPDGASCLSAQEISMTDTLCHELYASVIDHRDTFDFQGGGSTLCIDGSITEEYQEWCNDHYGATEFYEKYVQYEFECVYGFIRKDDTA